jgi:hypothetical protein
MHASSVGPFGLPRSGNTLGRFHRSFLWLSWIPAAQHRMNISKFSVIATCPASLRPASLLCSFSLFFFFSYATSPWVLCAQHTHCHESPGCFISSKILPARAVRRTDKPLLQSRSVVLCSSSALGTSRWYYFAPTRKHHLWSVPPGLRLSSCHRPRSANIITFHWTSHAVVFETPGCPSESAQGPTAEEGVMDWWCQWRNPTRRDLSRLPCQV